MGQPCNFDVVAATGQPAPGTDSSFTNPFYGSFAINDLGHIAFTSALLNTDPQLDNMNGAWVDRGHGLEYIASTQHTLPGTTETIAWVSQVLLNDAGDVGLLARIDDEKDAIFAETGAGFLPVATSGQIAPGANLAYKYFRHLEFTNDQHVIFSADLEDSWDPFRRNAGIWTNETGILTPIAFSGQELNGSEVITNIQSISGIATNTAGDVAFMTESMRLEDGVAVSSVWKYRAGNLNRILQTGDAAPGTNLYFQGLVRSPIMKINQMGQITFPFSTNVYGWTDGIWKDTSDGLVDVAIQDVSLQGSDTTLSIIWYASQINIHGHVLFIGRIKPGTHYAGTDLAAIVEMDGELNIALREGQSIPGMDDEFSESAIMSMQMNDSGTLAFTARIAGLGTPGTAHHSLWVLTRGTPELVLMAGDTIDIGLNDVRVLEKVGYFELNNVGQVAVAVDFTDGSQAILVSRPFIIPEPASIPLAMLLTGLAFITSIMYRRNQHRQWRLHSIRILRADWRLR